MSEPLIVVEGSLRLPKLRAPTDPFLNFGFEWSPARPRPVQSQSEIALFAARFLTAYVPALGLSDTRSPYRPTSLWGIIAREEVPQAMLRLTQAASGPGDASETRAEPIHLSVGAPAQVHRYRLSKPVAAAIAAACGVLIVWLLFGHAPVSRNEPIPATATREQPVQTVAAPPRAEPVVQVFETPAPSVAAVAVAPSAGIEPIATVDSAAPKIEVAPAAKDRARNGRVKVVLTPHAKPVEYRAHATSRRVAKQETSRHDRSKPVDKTANSFAARTRTASVEKFASQPSNASVPMDTTTLYSMLQHSPTLDSNAAASGRGAANGAR
ncbi:hypothetical protein NOV72_03104 [Caballeronia novacaledonica]|uniref:Uncharacterized protein n=1 Tax=Caballeronia novacaledonica TaxID=1544861 RepID=A0A2U3I6Z8_9BURK|nr:hypothetical protein [Caballeronia novacaledonica]SPB15898.1 hypothetical protein NOV72_03104 [Caballeronia novacaledonica]